MIIPHHLYAFYDLSHAEFGVREGSDGPQLPAHLLAEVLGN